MITGLWAFGTAIIAFLITALIGRFLIPVLHKINFGQTILEEGPSWHKGKQGTPTMGGIMFILGITLSTLIVVVIHTVVKGLQFTFVERSILIGLGMALCYGVIGFIDDYISVVKKRNMGLTAIQKMGLQVLVAIAYVVVMRLCGDDTSIGVPFVGLVNLGIFYYPIMVIVIVGFVNAVNLTDGIDGLNGSITFFVSLFLMLIANYFQEFEASVIFAAAIAGGCLGFLLWNFHPAKVFMGDTGSLFLGGIVLALAFTIDMQLMVILIGLVYIIEMFSVMIQVSYFKYTKRKYGKGRRVFRMTPIHHHFEMCGWSEVTIVVVFSMVTAIFGIAALILIMLG